MNTNIEQAQIGHEKLMQLKDNSSLPDFLSIKYHFNCVANLFSLFTKGELIKIKDIEESSAPIDCQKEATSLGGGL